MSKISWENRDWKVIIPILVGAISMAIGLYVTIALLSGNDWDPSLFIKFPEARPEQLAYGQAMLGEVAPAGGDGHDGKYYFMQAMDPLYLEPQTHAHLLDRPTYRAQRMLYPTVAGLFGTLPAVATAWGLWVVNMLALGVGGWLTARLAQQIGLSEWFGLAFALNPGVLVSSLIDTAEVFAMVFFVAAALSLSRKHYAAGAVWLTASALSRETMIVATIGAIAYLWREERRVRPIFALPFVASAVWWIYLRAQIGFLDSGIQDLAAIGLPFQGFYDAFQRWLNTPNSEADMLMGIVLMATSLLLVVRAFRQPSLLGYMSAGFALIAVTMVGDVWKFYFDASRALVPVITAYVLLIPTARIRNESEHQRSSVVLTGAS